LAKGPFGVDDDALFAVERTPTADNIVVRQVQVFECAVDDFLNDVLTIFEVKQFFFAAVTQAFEKNGAAVCLKPAGRKWPIVVGVFPGVLDTVADGDQ